MMAIIKETTWQDLLNKNNLCIKTSYLSNKIILIILFIQLEIEQIFLSKHRLDNDDKLTLPYFSSLIFFLTWNCQKIKDFPG